MPAKSKAQARLMFAVASGSVKKKGLKKPVAKEFASSTKSVKALPERIGNGKR